LAELRRVGGVANTSKLGDALLLEHRFQNVMASELVRLFGADFETALRALPTGEWRGPVPSGYGVHLVFVDKRDEGQAAVLEHVRDEVRREWIRDQREQANERFYTDLRKRYEVTVERSRANGGTLAAGMRQ
jgi:peptidyl-prolyl cis-trans isomerase C